jgi:hypothetical protein
MLLAQFSLVLQLIEQYWYLGCVGTCCSCCLFRTQRSLSSLFYSCFFDLLWNLEARILCRVHAVFKFWSSFIYKRHIRLIALNTIIFLLLLFLVWKFQRQSLLQNLLARILFSAKMIVDLLFVLIQLQSIVTPWNVNCPRGLAFLSSSAHAWKLKLIQDTLGVNFLWASLIILAKAC